MNLLKMITFFFATVITSVVVTLGLLFWVLNEPLGGNFKSQIVRGSSFWAGPYESKYPTAILEGSKGGEMSLVSPAQKYDEGSVQFKVSMMNDGSFSPIGTLQDKSGASIEFTFIHPKTPIKKLKNMKEVERIPCVVLRNARRGIVRFLCAE